MTQAGTKFMRDRLFDVSGKPVIITGGLGQLGRQFTKVLIERGAKVGIFDIAEPAKPLKALFGPRATGKNVLCIQADVANRDSLKKGLEAIEAQWGIPQGLVNNAALDSPPLASAEENSSFESYPESLWDRVMDVNTKGVFLACQVVGGRMAAGGRGSIVNISSIYGLVSPDQRIYEYRSKKGKAFFKPIAYSTSKSALLNMTRYLAAYWAPKKVRVNTLTPGGVFNRQDKQFLTGYQTRVPLGRMARADEYNGAILFLLSEASSYMTGSNLVVDGGWTAW